MKNSPQRYEIKSRKVQDFVIKKYTAPLPPFLPPPPPPFGFTPPHVDLLISIIYLVYEIGNKCGLLPISY